MRKSAVYLSMYSTITDIKDCCTASRMCVLGIMLLLCAADTRISTVCLHQSVLVNFPVCLLYQTHNTYYHVIYFIFILY